MFIEIAFCILALACPVLVFLAYRQGLRDGRITAQDRADAPPLPLEPLVRTPARPPEPTREEKEAAIILENIMAYNGTGRGQREVR